MESVGHGVNASAGREKPQRANGPLSMPVVWSPRGPGPLQTEPRLLATVPQLLHPPLAATPGDKALLCPSPLGRCHGQETDPGISSGFQLEPFVTEQWLTLALRGPPFTVGFPSLWVFPAVFVLGHV